MNTNQAEALKRVWDMAQGEHGGAYVCAKFLLGLFNGDFYPFDLTELRRLDDEMLEACITVLRMDATPVQEIHHHLNDLYGRSDMGGRLVLRACDLRLKKRPSKEAEKELRARLAGGTS
jgi:hypothetical protein